MQQAQRFGAAALASGIAPVRILMPSPIGPLGVELRSAVVTRVVIDPPATERATFTPLQEMRGGELLDEICGRLAEYFAGARRKLDVEWNLGPSACTGFARRVLKEAAKIPYGKTRTFEGIADATGRPEVLPQVLAVLLSNPIPIVIACHRVIAADGGLGGYVAGVERKRWLLSAESSQRTEP